MRKKRGIMLAAVLAAGLGGLVWLLFFKAEPEPVYQGKRLSAWLEAYTASASAEPAKVEQDATDALRHIGTNAIPTLLRMLRARDSALTLKLLALVQKQHFVRIHYATASERNAQAADAFFALRAELKDAVPALIEIYQQNISPDSRRFTLGALCFIGPDAKAAVPLLLKVATDTNTPDQNARQQRWIAIDALGRIHAEPELVVPAFAKALSNPEPEFRLSAVVVLRKYGPDAKAAVPALFELLKVEDLSTRLSAAVAIEKIDPEAAALRRAELDAAMTSPGPLPWFPPQTPVGKK